MAARRSDDDRPDYFRDMPEEFERRPGGPDRSPLRRRAEEPSEEPSAESDDGDEGERPS